MSESNASTLPRRSRRKQLSPRPKAGSDRAERLLAEEIAERRRIERLRVEGVEGGRYRPEPLPVRTEHLRAVRVRQADGGVPVGSLAYLCQRDRMTGEGVYRLVKLERVGGMTADVRAFDTGRPTRRVPLGCLSVVLVV